MTYKGEQADTNTVVIPVDAATVPGFCACLGSFLQNRSVSPDALALAWNTLEHLDKLSKKTGHLVLLPGSRVSKLPIEANRILLEDWSRCTSGIGLHVLAATAAKHLSCRVLLFSAPRLPFTSSKSEVLPERSPLHHAWQSAVRHARLETEGFRTRKSGSCSRDEEAAPLLLPGCGNDAQLL